MSSLLDAQPFAGALEAVERILNREPEADEALRQVVAALADRVAHYTWIGLYFVDGDELVLGPWQGDAERSEQTRLPRSAAGSIGRAIDERRTAVVSPGAGPEADGPRFPWARSEINVPVVYGDAVVAALGVDSTRPDAFGLADRAFLERVATLISAHCLVGWDTNGVPWPEVA